jgi:hypothetical protein
VAEERIEVLQRDGAALRPRLFLDPGIVRILIREDCVRAPRGQQEWAAVRIRAGVSISAVYGCMRRGQQRDRLPRAIDNSTVRLDGLTIRHRWRTGGGDHPYDPQNGAGSGFDEPPPEA